LRLTSQTLLALSMLLTAACGGGSSISGPTPMPTPTPRSIALGREMPSSGSTLSLGSCGFGTCSRALAYKFLVTFDVTIRDPVFRLRLTDDDGTECLSAYQLDLLPVIAGEPHIFAGQTLLLSTTPPARPGVGIPNCEPPFTTTTIATELHDTEVTGPILLAQEFAVTYHWVR